MKRHVPGWTWRLCERGVVVTSTETGRPTLLPNELLDALFEERANKTEEPKNGDAK